jgi:hypothetical protein
MNGRGSFELSATEQEHFYELQTWHPYDGIGSFRDRSFVHLSRGFRTAGRTSFVSFHLAASPLFTVSGAVTHGSGMSGVSGKWAWYT